MHARYDRADCTTLLETIELIFRRATPFESFIAMKSMNSL